MAPLGVLGRHAAGIVPGREGASHAQPRISTMEEELPDDIKVEGALDGKVEGRGMLLLGGDIGVRSCFKEKPDRDGAPALNGKEEGRLASVEGIQQPLVLLLEEMEEGVAEQVGVPTLGRVMEGWRVIADLIAQPAALGHKHHWLKVGGFINSSKVQGLLGDLAVCEVVACIPNCNDPPWQLRAAHGQNP